MLISFAIIFISAIFIGKIFEKLRFPALFGMIIVGIAIGPYGINLLSAEIIDLSPILRQIALIIILARAGLNLDISQLKKVGRPAILMCFVPACFEICATIIFAPKILGISWLEAGLMGCVIAAVSPAVIVPKMLALIEKGMGKEKAIPQMIMAGASVDDVFVIVLFSVFLSLNQSGTFTPITLARIPTSIVLGILAGFVLSKILPFILIVLNINQQTIIFLSISFVLVWSEGFFGGAVGFSGLLAIMALGGFYKIKNDKNAADISAKLSGLWSGAEIWLFVLVGATVNMEFALKFGIAPVILILILLSIRTCGVLTCLIGTALNKKEKMFCAMAYLPKATVQAAIGGVALSENLSCGDIVLTIAVVSILISAPLGAFLIDMFQNKCLSKN